MMSKTSSSTTTTTQSNNKKQKKRLLFLPNGIHKKKKACSEAPVLPRTTLQTSTTTASSIPRSPSTNTAATLGDQHSCSSPEQPSSSCIQERQQQSSLVLPPTIQGVCKAARLLRANQTVILPTESVYTKCTTITLQPQESSVAPDFKDTPLFVYIHPRAPSSLSWCWSPPKPYALRHPTMEQLPVWLCEAQEVLTQLAGSFWPGPMPIYVRVDNKNGDWWKQKALLHTTQHDNHEYVGIQCPSHPLMARVQQEVTNPSDTINDKDSHQQKTTVTVVVGRPTTFTRASDIVLTTQQHDETTLHTNESKHHVLNGEDQRELFAVPTCQYKTPCPTSLWMDDSTRTVYIQTTEQDSVYHPQLSKATVERALWSVSTRRSPPSSPTTTMLSSNATVNLTASTTSKASTTPKQRVVAGVLRKWRVVDRNDIR